MYYTGDPSSIWVHDGGVSSLVYSVAAYNVNTANGVKDLWLPELRHVIASGVTDVEYKLVPNFGQSDYTVAKSCFVDSNALIYEFEYEDTTQAGITHGSKAGIYSDGNNSVFIEYSGASTYYTVRVTYQGNENIYGTDILRSPEDLVKCRLFFNNATNQVEIKIAVTHKGGTLIGWEGVYNSSIYTYTDKDSYFVGSNQWIVGERQMIPMFILTPGAGSQNVSMNMHYLRMREQRIPSTY
jgi:hypothetical protein